MKEFLAWIEERLATGEGGAPSVEIGWDDATRDYLIVQKFPRKYVDGKFVSQGKEILGCSRSLGRAVELAISGKVYD